MSDDVDSLVQQAIQAYNQGDTDTARERLLDATEQDPDHEQAWVWMSKVAADEQEEIICLENILYINPDNQDARRRMAELRGDAEDAEGAPAEEPEVSAADSGAEDMEFDLFDESDFGVDESGASATGGPFGADYEFDAAEEVVEEAEPEPESTARPRSPMEGQPSSPSPDVRQPTRSERPSRERASRKSSAAETEVGGDPFALIPSNIEPTRVPGANETYPGWLVPGIVLLFILNLVGLALLVLNTGA